MQAEKLSKTNFLSELNNTSGLRHMKLKTVGSEYPGMAVKVEETHFIGKFISGSKKFFSDEVYISRTAAAGKCDGSGEKSAISGS